MISMISPMGDRITVATAFAQTLWITQKGRSRHGFERWQKARLQTWLRHDLPRVPFYAKADPQLVTLPVIDKAIMMARFADFNQAGISAPDGWRAFHTTGETNGVSIGASTGTSGNRTLYAVTKAEQFRWLGTILAKTVPGFLWRPERVAVLLPQVSALYDNANRSSRINLKFFDLNAGPESWLSALETFAPSTIIAPPRVLRYFAEQDTQLAPRKIYAGGETLDPVDRAIIETRFGLTLGQIYMASEGLFAVSCAHGRLHLAEDANYFEFEAAGDTLVSPLVTSFQRRFQILARYRMNDLLDMGAANCTCGSPLRVVNEVVGRMDDVFVFERTGQRDVLITPDILRNVVLSSAAEITDFRVQRTGVADIVLTLTPDLSNEAATAAKTALETLFLARNLAPQITISRSPLDFRIGPKLRRVENCYRVKR